MNSSKFLLPLLITLIIASCGGDNSVKKSDEKQQSLLSPMPLDKGFSEYIASYTSGIVPANSVIEIRFTESFASTAEKKNSSSLFSFEPAIKGKAEWVDETTLRFVPSKLLDPGIIYTGELNLLSIGTVQDRLKTFPFRIQTLKKDFTVATGNLQCSNEVEGTYDLSGELITSDYVAPEEVEGYLTARLGRKKREIKWEHAEGNTHKFIVSQIPRGSESTDLIIEWDGTQSGASQQGSETVTIPQAGLFQVIEVKRHSENNSVEIIFSDPIDPSQELSGLIFFDTDADITTNSQSNIVTVIPSAQLVGEVTLTVGQAIKNTSGATLNAEWSIKLDFTTLNPEIELAGKGVILPSSGNLIFPFRAAGLRAVDMKIIRIFENNLPYFLQESDINSGYNIKRFGRPVWSGKVDLPPTKTTSQSTWSLYTIDLSDYIDVEPGILYKVQLSMRKSYSILPCAQSGEKSRYEELLDEAQQNSEEFWSDSEYYYDDNEANLYYSLDFDWEDRDDPCKEAYYSPDKSVSRNVLASNLGLMVKMGEDDVLHAYVNDLITALPVGETNIEVYDYQMQLIAAGATSNEGTLSLFCGRKPFLIIAKKDKDRNYLKVNEGSSLSLSSFDVSGNKPENGIKAFIYGERDVWRPGDSIFLGLFLKDMKSDLPPNHPVQFELVNPLEQRVDNQVHKFESGNLLVITTKTSDDAVTGTYQARFKIGGATFTKRIRIETVKPNRLKINFALPDRVLGGTEKSTSGTLNVKWLNGSVAGNLNASVDYLLKPVATQFEKYKQYTFDNPTANYYAQTTEMFQGSVDESGNAKVNFSPDNTEGAPGMLNAIFTVKVMEKGGDESITQVTRKYAPYSHFVGINLPGLEGKGRMLFTDTDNEIKIATVDQDGKSVRSDVEISIYKLSYRWWWESNDENLAYYISNNIYKPVFKEKVTTTGGEASVKFNISKEKWGRYLIRATTESGHSTGKMVLVDWPWEYGMKSNTDGATLISVSTDKEKYNPGDEAKISFPSPENGRVILTLENATGVLEELRVPTTKGNTEITFKITPEMAPNVYAYVTVIQPHGQTVNDMPMRLFGVVPVMVEDPETRLEPQITAPDEVRSQRAFEVKVSEAGKKPMIYTVAVVDEGLLDITSFRTPQPWDYFYAREALGVKTWDLYDYVLGAYGGTLERLLAVGGDESSVDKTQTKARRFIPVVKYYGPFELKAGATNNHKILLPRYTGSVRTMVVAGNDRSFGSAEKSIVVKDPLMVLVTAPRVISPGEKASLPVTLFINNASITRITLKAESNGMVTFGEKTKEINVSGATELDTEFSFTAASKAGVAILKVTAEGNGETADFEIELEVRNPNPPETRAEMKLLKPGEKWNRNMATFGIEGSNSASVEISSLPSVNLGKRLSYLVNYPHGCSEQITSAVFPQIWISKLSGNNAVLEKESSINIRAAINQLNTRQMQGGGIALWPGSMQPDSWVTSYAGHFLIEAERAGYNVPSGLKNRWLNYQQRTAREWRYDPIHRQSATDQAYRLFTMALTGAPDKGAMNRLRESAPTPALAKWLLAAAYAVSGRPEAADELLNMTNTSTEADYYNYYYGSQLRDKSVILYTLTLLKKDDVALPLLKDICASLNTESWYSTQSVSWGLFSYMKWAEGQPEGSGGPVKAAVSMNNEKSEMTAASKQIITRDLKVNEGSNSLVIENTSGESLYATVVQKGVPLISDNAIIQKGLSMKVEYLNSDLQPVDVTNLKQGTDFIMSVKVSNTSFSRVENLALTAMVPSGWEIQNTRLFEAVSGIKEGEYDYRDFRDDRVNTYFSLAAGESKTFVMMLNAAYRGEFYRPAIICEAMYSEAYLARVPGTNVTVRGE